MSNFHDDVMEYLKKYPIENLNVTNQGKHLKCKFLLKGEPHQIIIAKTPSDWRAADNTKADIRRELGGPPAAYVQKLQPHNRTLEEMTAQLRAEAAPRILAAIPPAPNVAATESKQHWLCRVAMYRGKTGEATGAVRFSFPEDALKALGEKRSGSFNVGFKKPRTFDIMPGVGARVRGQTGCHFIGDALETSHALAAQFLGSFKLSPATCIMKNGGFEVTLDAMPKTTPPPTISPFADTPPQSVKPPLKADAIVNTKTSISSEDMKSCLTELNRIIAETPYRLVRLENGKYAFKAPLIEANE